MLSVYTIIPPKASASFYYRLDVPIRTAEDLGLPVKVLVDTDSASIPEQERIDGFCNADVLLLYQPVGDSPIRNVRGIQSFIPSLRDGEWKWPPTVVLESDDNLFNVSPLNQAFRTLGIRDMDGNMIPPGHHIGIIRDGERRILWRDGEKGFSIGANRQRINSYRKLLEMADCVQVSTAGVGEAMKKELTPRRLKVWPNLVRMDDYEQVDLREDPKTIKILWQGGIAHYEDWFPLRDALGKITKKYPEVHWIIWGAQFPWVNELIPAHRYTFKSWCAYHEYKLRLAMIGHDISLAPLTNNVFNSCRSAIKWYESSVLRKPVATLAQNTGAYKDEIEDGMTGMLFNDPEEFEDKLSTLIEDARLRIDLGRNAKDWISENRDARKKVPEMVQYWTQLREERKREQPHVTPEHWAEIEAEAQQEQESAALHA